MVLRKDEIKLGENLGNVLGIIFKLHPIQSIAQHLREGHKGCISFIDTTLFTSFSMIETLSKDLPYSK